VGYELDSPIGQELKGLYLESKVGEIGGEGELQKEERPKSVIGEKRFGIAGINKDRAENEAGYPDDGAASVEWAGLQHRYS
jgi:hypothetical protein